MTSIEQPKQIPIVDVEYGLANNFGTHIEINKNLRNYPVLLDPILQHERAHTDKAVSWQDFKLDFMMKEALHYKELFKFMIRHPKSLTQLLPLYYSPRKKQLIYDFNLVVMYLIMLVVVIVPTYFGVKYL